MTEHLGALREFVLAFADDEHLMGQQHTEWIGVAPFLEEDLAFSSIGQDELGHAALLYDVVLELDGAEVDDLGVDALAYGRGGSEYRSSHLAEYVTIDWAEALVRHWVYDTAEALRWQLLEGSSHQDLAEILVRVGREESYHVRHADALLDSLLSVPDAAQRLNTALDAITALIPGVLADVADESALVEAGVLTAPSSSALGALADAVEQRFGRRIELSPPPERGSDRSASFGPLMARMREVIELDLNAVW